MNLPLNSPSTHPVTVLPPQFPGTLIDRGWSIIRFIKTLKTETLLFPKVSGIANPNLREIIAKKSPEIPRLV